jgi:hypothetical protein
MFGKSEDKKYCKNCKNYWKKDWSVNNECKLGKPTPKFGDTPACDKFEEKHGIFG